jgi:hypothetical protein
MEDAFLGTFTRHFMTATAALAPYRPETGTRVTGCLLQTKKRERHRFSRPVTLRRKVQSRV